MGTNPAAASSSLRCCSAGAAVPRSAWVRSAGFLVRCSRNNGVGLKLSCVAPTASSYAHNSDSESKTLPAGSDGWWGEALLDEDAKFFPPADLFPVGQGKEEVGAILIALVAAPLDSIVLTLREIMAAGNLFRCRSFHVGTLSGALLVVAGLCQLWKTTPTLFVDIVLGYIFYKLSTLSAQLQRDGRSFSKCARIQLGALLVVAGLCQLWKTTPTLFVDIVFGYIFYKLSALSAQLQRDGKSFSICARIQLVLLLVLSFKDNSAFQGFYRYLVEVVWMLNIFVYLALVYDGAVGVKDGRLEWLAMYRLLRTKGGLMKVVKYTFGGDEKPVSVNKKCQ